MSSSGNVWAVLRIQQICNTTRHKSPIYGLLSFSKRSQRDNISTIQCVLRRFRKVYYTSGLLSWGVFCQNCGIINEEYFTYTILLSSDYQQVNKCQEFLYFMEFELQCIMIIIIRRIFILSIMEIRQLLKLIQLDASRSFAIKAVKVDFSVVCVTSR